MRTLFAIGIVNLFWLPLLAQKKALDYSSIENWPSINKEKISNDGKYISYTINSHELGSTLIIQSVNSTWKKEVPGGSNAIFTDDDTYVIYKSANDSLCILNLKENSCEKISNVISFKLQMGVYGEWLAYLLDGHSKDLVLRCLNTGKIIYYPLVVDYLFSQNSKVLLLKSSSNIVNDSSFIISWINLKSAESNIIWRGKHETSNYVFDTAADRLAFISKSSLNADSQNIIYQYRSGMASANIRVQKESAGMEPGFVISNASLSFSLDGLRLFFKIQRDQSLNNTNSGKANESVSIWSYKDEIIKSEQLAQDEQLMRRQYLCVINDNKNSILRLVKENDSYIMREERGGDGEYLLIYSKMPNVEAYWNRSALPNMSLVSTSSGSRIVVRKSLMDDYKSDFSPMGKFLIWYDRLQGNYFTYDLKTHVARNITSKIPYHIYEENNDHAILPPLPYGLVGWLRSDSTVFICDRYDIWMVDPSGLKNPVNITKGYGRKNRIVLRFALEMNSNLDPMVIDIDKNIYFAGFNEITKENGFFKAEIRKSAYPILLYMGHFAYYFPLISNYSGTYLSNFLVKSKYSEVYLLKRMSARDYPNLFCTQDFKGFRKLSDLEPQKTFNWLTSSLLHYKLPNGKFGEGILYKPENFDSTRKYPVIFYFYQKYADGINKFLKPDLSSDDINIPMFVSNGYLVVVPDIYYKIGYTGQSVVNSVSSAALCISKYGWADKNRFGLQGHSLGGYEVNELITRTNMFSAAISAAGASDCISLFGSILYGSGLSNECDVETGVIRLGSTPWERKDLYIENSPIFRANKVNTPLLIMHNIKDGNVPYSQGIEFFSALRRLRKPVWMLQYSDEAHSIYKKVNQLDYSEKLFQFFDHYLKDKPAPRWMSE